jgi:serine/threonine protein kinase
MTMDADKARALLGVDPGAQASTLRGAHQAKVMAVQQRAQAAPTQSLRDKYQQAQHELDQALAALLADLESAPAGISPLSATQMADLPNPRAHLTEAAVGAGGAPAAQIKPGEVLAGRYEIKECVGQGGMGAVYRAFDRNRQEDMAIKVLLPHLLRHPVARDRFMAEAKISISLAHPNIVNVFDVQREGETDFITMELLKGRTLRAIMQERARKHRGFTVEEALVVIRAVGQALEYAHRYTVHRDVKPENVWVDESKQIKLMDFGIARLMSNSKIAQTAAAMGTAYYMAPEQLISAKDVDGRADQYALAVMFYELVAGTIPAGRYKPLREVDRAVSAQVSAAVDRALAGRPGERFNTVADFLAALAAKGSWVQEWLTDPVKKPWLIGGGALGCAVLLLGLWWVVPSPWQSRDARAAAVQAQGMAETQLKRLENGERELDSAVREARSLVDRLESGLRNARGTAERQDMGQRLALAKRQLLLAEETKTVLGGLIYGTDAIAQLRGQLAVGTSALRDNQVSKAARELQTAQQQVEKLQDMARMLRETLQAAARIDSVYEDFDRIGDADRELKSGYRTAYREGRALLAKGQYLQAHEKLVPAASELEREFNSKLEAHIERFTRVANQAVESGNTDVAQEALMSAKALESLRR